MLATFYMYLTGLPFGNGEEFCTGSEQLAWLIFELIKGTNGSLNGLLGTMENEVGLVPILPLDASQ